MKISGFICFIVNNDKMKNKKTGNLRVNCLAFFTKVFTNLGKKFPTIKLAVILLSHLMPLCYGISEHDAI